MMGVRFQGGDAVAGSAAGGTGGTRRLLARAAAAAVLALVGAASNASALILSGGPVYNLPGGGSCTVSGRAGTSPGATVSCTGVNLGSHTRVYFGIRNDTNPNGNTMTGATPSGAAIFTFLSSTASSITYASSTTINDVMNGVVLPTNNRLVVTQTGGGSTTVVSTAGNPADTANGHIQRLFQLNTGSSFTFRVDVTASNADFPSLVYALSGLYDPTHTPSSGTSDVSRIDLAFYFSDCGDGVVDSPEQCDQGSGVNGTSTSCCTATCTFRSASQICRPGAGAPCDASEQCTGTSGLCPGDDAPLNLGNVCRPGSGDVCDQNETCTGMAGQGCPTDDAPTNTTIICRAGSLGDACDQPEACSGVPGATCPADDAPGNINQVCRPGSGDVCDPAEQCSGVPGQFCPPDVVSNPSTLCRAGSGDACDPSEFCTAVPGAPCPGNTVTPNGTTCRAAAGVCDVVEQCTGSAGQTCPSDAKAAATTPCNVDNNVCTVDACDGSGTCTFGSALSCDDGNTCTQDTCDAQDGCEYTGAPSNSCTSASKALLKIRNSGSDSGDSVKFLWKGGPSLVPDMGDPTQTTSYELCIYDNTGVQMALGVAPGANWSPLGPPATPKGYKFKDNGAAQDGVKLIKTKGSNLDKAQVKLVAKGVNVPDTGTLPMQYPVTAQVYASDGMCWNADFTQLQTKQNETGKFNAKLP